MANSVTVATESAVSSRPPRIAGSDGAPFVAIARAKGLSPARVAVRHVLRNALIPVVTLLGLSLPALFSGAVFIEAGNVWQDPWTMRLRDLRYDAGPGLRLDTPFGLIRVDFGYQLRPVDGLRIDGKRMSGEL